MDLDKDFVPCQESLELKEIGFNEPCFAYYDEDIYLFTVREQDDVCDYWTPAPTFSQAFRFFREKYQASPSIHCMSEQGNSWRYHIPNEGGENNFLIYEEAELACLKKLIEIVKSDLATHK